MISISKLDVELDENGGLMLDNRIFAALGSVCGAVGDGNGAIACFRARDKVREEIVDGLGESGGADFLLDDTEEDEMEFQALK